MSNRRFDVTAFTVLTLLSAMSTLYLAFGDRWELSHVTEVVMTLSAINTSLALLLALSTAKYPSSEAKFDGTMEIVEHEEGTKSFLLNLDGDPYELVHQRQVIFKVKKIDGDDDGP